MLVATSGQPAMAMCPPICMMFDLYFSHMGASGGTGTDRNFSSPTSNAITLFFMTTKLELSFDKSKVAAQYMVPLRQIPFVSNAYSGSSLMILHAWLPRVKISCMGPPYLPHHALSIL